MIVVKVLRLGWQDMQG